MTMHTQNRPQQDQPSRPWYRETAMMVVIGVLTFTLLSGTAMVTIAMNSHDPLVISDQQYQQLRDELRATEGRATE